MTAEVYMPRSFFAAFYKLTNQLGKDLQSLGGPLPTSTLLEEAYARLQQAKGQ